MSGGGVTSWNDEAFVTANAAFLDVLIRRWERIVDFHAAVRHGFHDPDDPPDEERLVADLAFLDSALREHRAHARERGFRFPFDLLLETYSLDQNEADILALALMPQLDLGFRQRIARCNNNILYDFVDVDLALGILFDERVEQLKARRYFADSAPLMRHRLLVMAPPKESKGSGLLAQELRPPERLSDYVLGRRTLDASLRPFAELGDPSERLSDVAMPAHERRDLQDIIRHFRAAPDVVGPGAPFPAGGGLTIAFVGPSGTGKTLAARAVAGELGRALISVDAARLASASGSFQDLVDALFGEASVQGAVVLLDRCEAICGKNNQRLPALFDQMDRFGGLTILTTSAPDDLDPSVERHVTWQLKTEMPEVDLRLQMWKQHLPQDVPVDPELDLDDLATRYEVNGGQIRNACVLAATEVQAHEDDGAMITLERLHAAAQAQLRADMEEYSVKSKVTLTLDDLILPDKEKALLHELLDACQHRVFVMSKWGFGRRLVTGKGITALFKGEPGTGKTLAAEIIAHTLGMRLYQISIPRVVSKYIGETEKNISRIFQTARANHSMLLFDEADALFTKRVNVENAIDRFSNMEVNLLLQEIERFEGVTILTTNLDKNIDDAFSRRIQFKIDFPFPKEEARAKIWKLHIPKECPVDDDIDFEFLGEAYEISGGFIKNAIVRAAYRAAAAGTPIGPDDIEFAAEQECRSAGKLFRTSKSRNADSDW